MAKLDIYKQQIDPRVGVGPGPSMRAPRVGRGETELLAGAAQAVATVGQAVQKRREDEAAIDATSIVLEARKTWAEQTRQREEAARETGQLDGYAGTLDEDFRKFSDETVARAKTPAAQAWLRERMGVLGLDLFERGMAFEATAKVDRDSRLAGQSLETARVVVDLDASQYEQARQDLSLQYSRLPPEKRAALWQAADQSLAMAAGVGQVRETPDAVLAALDAEPGKSGVPFIDNLGADGRLSLRQMAETEINRREGEARARQSEYREGLRQRINDQTAMVYDGQTVTQPIRKAEFVAAGMEDAYTDYQDTLQMGPDLARLPAMPESQMAELLAVRKPTTEAGYASDSKRYNALRGAAIETVNARNADPVGFASAHRLARVAPLDPAKPAEFSAELRNRAVVAQSMTRQFGTPYTLLTKGEVGQFTDLLGGLTATEKAGLFQQVRQGLPDEASYHAMMAQLRPDSPVTAMAGSMMAVEARVRTADGGWFSSEGYTGASAIAQRILQGEDLLNPTKGAKGQDGKPRITLPSDADLRDQWASYTGNAYRGNPEVHDHAYQAFRAYYAAEMADLGKYDGELDSTVAARAARAVSGGVADVGGSQIVLPFGMSEEATFDRLGADWASARKAAGLPEGLALDSLQLLTTMDGVYLVTMGGSPLKGKDGKPIYLRAKP